MRPPLRARKPPPDAWRSAGWTAIVLAAGSTLFGAIFVGDVARTPGEWRGWYVVVALVVAASWTGVWAWRARRWAVAAPAFAITAFSPWAGFLLAPIISLALAVSSVVALIRDRSRARNATQSE